MKHDLSQGSVFHHFIRYLIPAIASMIGLSLYILVDTIFIGQGVGVDGLTALNISLPIFTMFICIGSMLNMGGSTAFAVSLGQKDDQQAHEIFTLTLIMGLVAGILFMVINLVFLDELCRFLGASDRVFAYVRIYSLILICFSPAFIINSVLSGFIRNDHAPRLVMISGLSGNFINIGLDALFIFVFHWGIVGAILATVISPVISILILLYHLKDPHHHLRLVKVTQVISKMRRILKNGFPSFLDGIAPGIVIFAFNQVILGLSGDLGVAAYSIIANIAFIGSVLFIGTGQAMQALSAHNFGAGHSNRVRKVFQLALITSFGIGIAKMLLIMGFPQQIIQMFNSQDVKLIKVATQGLMLYFLSMPFMALNVIIVIYLQSIEKSVSALWITLCRTIFLIIIGLLILPKYFGLTGVWLIVPVAELITMLIGVGYLAKIRHLPLIRQH